MNSNIWELISILLFNSVYIVGLYNAMDYDMIKIDDWSGGKWGEKEVPTKKQVLWFIPYYTQWLPQIIRTPLYDCINCMASIHGFYFYWFFFDFNFFNIFVWIFYTFALSGLNSIINAAYSGE